MQHWNACALCSRVRGGPRSIDSLQCHGSLRTNGRVRSAWGRSCASRVRLLSPDTDPCSAPRPPVLRRGRYLEKIKKRRSGGGAGASAEAVSPSAPGRTPEVPSRSASERERNLQPGTEGGKKDGSGSGKAHAGGALAEAERAHKGNRNSPAFRDKTFEQIVHTLPGQRDASAVKKDKSPKADWKRLFSQKSSGKDGPPGTAREHGQKGGGEAGRAAEPGPEGSKKKKQKLQHSPGPGAGGGGVEQEKERAKGNGDGWGKGEEIGGGDGTFPYEVHVVFAHCVPVCLCAGLRASERVSAHMLCACAARILQSPMRTAVFASLC